MLSVAVICSSLLGKAVVAGIGFPALFYNSACRVCLKDFHIVAQRASMAGSHVFFCWMTSLV